MLKNPKVGDIVYYYPKDIYVRLTKLTKNGFEVCIEGVGYIYVSEIMLFNSKEQQLVNEKTIYLIELQGHIKAILRNFTIVFHHLSIINKINKQIQIERDKK